MSEMISEIVADLPLTNLKSTVTDAESESAFLLKNPLGINPH